VLKVTGCGEISSVGWQPFATALALIDNIEDIDLVIASAAILNAVIAKPSLKRVSLKLITIDQFQVIANVLESLNCGIIELDIEYTGDQSLGQLEREQLTQTLVNSLQRNTSLRTLKISYWQERFYQSDEDELPHFRWPSVSNLLCDTSSIDTTMQSNHTLESVYGPLNSNKVPINIYSILFMNRNMNKHAVIREKLLRNHNLDQINFVPTSLPIVFSWLGDAGVDQRLGLSQLFRMLRAMPYIIRDKVGETRGVKRKELNGD
jgi:hypothetical protein